MCFVLAAFNYPGAIRAAWGRMAEELDAETWDLLDGPGTAAVQNDRGLGRLLKMTRCADLGLGEMFFPDDEDAQAFGDKQDGEEDEEEEEEDYGVVVEVSPARYGLGLDLHPPASLVRDPGALVQGVEALSLTA